MYKCNCIRSITIQYSSYGKFRLYYFVICLICVLNIAVQTTSDIEVYQTGTIGRFGLEVRCELWRRVNMNII